MSETLSVEKRYELGADLIKLAEKYTGLKKGRVQKILIKSEVNEVTAMEITLLL